MARHPHNIEACLAFNMTTHTDSRLQHSVFGLKTIIVLLLGILAIGFWLRTKEITWGLPDVHPILDRTMDALHPDESVLVQEANDLFDKGIFHIETLRYPPLHAQLTAILAKWLPGSGRLWQRFLEARGISIAASLGSLILLYFIGLRWKSSVALMACAFLSVSMVAVRESHWANPESLSAFWVLTAFLLLIRIEQSPRKSLYILMGIALALGIASKYFAALFVHLPILAVLLNSRTDPSLSIDGSRSSNFRKTLQTIVPAGVSFAVALFLLLGIYIVQNPKMFFQAYETHSLWAAHNGLYGIFPKPTSAPTYIFSILPIALAPPVYLLALAGMILSIMKRRQIEITLIGGTLPFWIFLELLRYHTLRFSLNLAPILCLFAAIFFDFVFSKRSKLLSGLGIAVFFSALIYSGIYSFAFINVLQPKQDARRLADEWLAVHASGSRPVTLLGGNLQSNSLGFIRYDGMDRLSGIGYNLASGFPEFVVVPKHVAHIFDQHEKLTMTGYRYSAQDWAPMNAPSNSTFVFYKDMLAKGTFRPVARFDSVPRFGPWIFYSEPLKFDLALTNLEVVIYRKQ
jgi:hypothetical protein